IPKPNEIGRVRAAPKNGGGRRRKSNREPPQELQGPEAEARALILRDWRKRFAKERDVPAFIIFSDRTLKDLASRNPRTLGDLESVYGLGPAKIELFGGELLKELGQC